jgi:predicted nucleic acid-binding protein
MVASLCGWYEQHDAAAKAVNDRLDAGQVMVIAGPAVVEAYAVLTRLPPPHRLSPAVALAAIERSFMGESVELVSLEPGAYLRLLRTAPGRDIAGGTTYDAVIMACAEMAQVDTLLTFNARHFRQFEVEGVQIVVPA